MEATGPGVRFRLAALWLSQVARILADNCVRVFVVLEVARAGTAQREAAWHEVAGLLALPAIFLSPFNGIVSNSLPKRGVLVGAAAWCLAVLCLFGFLGGPWLACWGLLAVGALVYSPTRYALLPAAAQDTGIPLTRVNGWIEMGAVLSLVGGMLLGARLHAGELAGLPAAVVVAGGLGLASLLFALPVAFPSDVRRKEAVGAALAGFVRDARQVLRSVPARNSLLGLALLRGLVTAMTGAVVACALGLPGLEMSAESIDELIRAGGWVLAGVAAGSVLAGVQGHPYRCLGLIPLGALGLLVGLVVAALIAPEPLPSWLCVLLGLMGGLMNIPLAATYQASVPADARGNAMAIRNLAEYLCMSAAAALFFVVARLRLVSPAGQLWLLAGLTAGAAAVSVVTLLRPLLEQLMELVLWPMYRVRARGPGVGSVPVRGPLLIVANHSSYLDPLWVGKVIPRKLTPMMTSVFYDKPALRWLMERVVQAIRVQAATYRRDVPEIEQAVAALDRGDCVVIFPEGMLRRKDDRPLRQFGQGVWRILCERPRTPVLVFWIEGGWGSLFSYRGGLPGTNKPIDWWRHIDIAIPLAEVLDVATLADQRETRTYLMRRCLENRKYLGLEPFETELLSEDV